MITHEAVLGGARWRLTLHPDGRYEIAAKKPGGWDDMFAGDGGLDGLKGAIRDFPDLIASWFMGANVLQALADVAERSTTP